MKSSPSLGIEEANELVLERVLSSQPAIIDVKSAIDVIPGMIKNTLLHPGPPIEWERMCSPMKGAIIGALIYEGLAEKAKDAEKMMEKGEIIISPTHHHGAISGMAGIISASMPVFVVENKTHGNVAYSPIREGTGKALRFGAYDDGVIRKLRWVEEVLGPAMKTAIEQSGPIDLQDLIARALHMGDECHSRCIATTMMFEKILIKHLIKSDFDRKEISQIASFFRDDQNFGLCLIMGAGKAIMDAAKGIKGSTIVTAMTRNGVDFGIRVSGLGDRWFIAPSPSIDGIYFSGFGPGDANPDVGDSSITETIGLGGLAMAAAPTIAQLEKRGDILGSAIEYTNQMYDITFGKHKVFTIPILNFAGVPLGIDIRKVVEKGVSPLINTAIAHKEMGQGMIGLGIARAPMGCFIRALEAITGEIGSSMRS